MADFGLVGGAVFYNNKMMSQQGTDSRYTYTDFKEDSNGKPTGVFEPNFFVNLVTGYLKANNVDITGKVNATDGKFTGEIYATNGTFNAIGTEGMVSITKGSVRIEQYSDLYTNINHKSITILRRNSGVNPTFKVDTFDSLQNSNMLLVVMKGLPTSSAGLPSGGLWRSGSDLKIVP